MGQSIDYVQDVFGTERCLGVGGGLLEEITVWWLFRIPPQTQTFINDYGSGRELVAWSKNDFIGGSKKWQKKSLNFSKKPQNAIYYVPVDCVFLWGLSSFHSLEPQPTCVCVCVCECVCAFGCEERQMCWAPVACCQRRREDPAASRTVELVWVDTDAQGHTGRPLCRHHLCTDTRTHARTHLGWEAAAKCHCVSSWIRETAAVLLSGPAVERSTLAGRLQRSGSGSLAHWLSVPWFSTIFIDGQ